MNQESPRIHAGECQSFSFCRDPFDIPFLLLAVVGQANYLVTGDGDLLCLSDKFSCPILTVDQFLTVINYQSL